jgi:hypothetical protein
MKGAAAVLVILFAGLAAGNPPIKEPLQFEQACNNLKVAGTGIVDVSTTMIDKRIALEYSSALAGDGPGARLGEGALRDSPQGEERPGIEQLLGRESLR